MLIYFPLRKEIVHKLQDPLVVLRGLKVRCWESKGDLG
jgi:hypothetical protein